MSNKTIENPIYRKIVMDAYEDACGEGFGDSMDDDNMREIIFEQNVIENTVLECIDVLKKNLSPEIVDVINFRIDILKSHFGLYE